MKSLKSRGNSKVGLGIFSVPEARASLSRKDPQFLSCFTPHELDYCLYKKRTAAQSLSARMAAKLAFWDALGIVQSGGVPGCATLAKGGTCQGRLRDVQIESRMPGPPRLKIASALRRRLGIGARSHILVSLTHEKEFGMAIVLIER